MIKWSELRNFRRLDGTRQAQILFIIFAFFLILFCFSLVLIASYNTFIHPGDNHQFINLSKGSSYGDSLSSENGGSNYGDFHGYDEDKGSSYGDFYGSSDDKTSSYGDFYDSDEDSGSSYGDFFDSDSDSGGDWDDGGDWGDGGDGGDW